MTTSIQWGKATLRAKTELAEIQKRLDAARKKFSTLDGSGAFDDCLRQRATLRDEIDELVLRHDRATAGVHAAVVRDVQSALIQAKADHAKTAALRLEAKQSWVKTAESMFGGRRGREIACDPGKSPVAVRNAITAETTARSRVAELETVLAAIDRDEHARQWPSTRAPSMVFAGGRPPEPSYETNAIRLLTQAA